MKILFFKFTKYTNYTFLYNVLLSLRSKLYFVWDKLQNITDEVRILKGVYVYTRTPLRKLMFFMFMNEARLHTWYTAVYRIAGLWAKLLTKKIELRLSSVFIACVHNNYFINSINIFINWFYIIIQIIIYIGIFLLITYNTPICINMELWTNIVEFVLMKIGLMKVKLISCNKVIILANYRSIYGIKSYILICGIWYTIISILFIVCNIHYIILNILGIILTRAFVLNFYAKHLAPFVFVLDKLNFNTVESNNNSSSSFARKSEATHLNKWMQVQALIWNNRVILMHFFFKLILISWLIVIIIRYSVLSLFMGSFMLAPETRQALNDNFISNGLIILLPLPICSYLINFVTKKIKNKKITSKDYYLYNEFVVNSVNLYRMTLILCINYTVRNYYYIYYGTIIVLVILLLIILCIYYMFYIRNHEPSATTKERELSFNCNEVRTSLGNKPIILESNSGDVIAMVTAFIGISPILQDACNTGYNSYMNYTGKGLGHLNWKNLPFSKPGQYCIGTSNKTVNFLWKPDPLYRPQERLEDLELFREEKLKIRKSPILNMTYLLKNNEATLRTPYKWGIRPINFFNHEKFHGSISQTRIGNFLIFIIIRKDLNKVCTFMPSFFLPDNTVEGQARIRDIVHLLEIKYSIHIPKGVIRKNGLIVFTQAESIGDNGLVRLWRPSLAYTDPEILKKETRVRDYYKLDNSELTRLDDFNYNGSIDLIKNLVVKNSVDTLKDQHKHMQELITNEVIADRICRTTITNFVNWGVDVNLANEYLHEEETIWKKDEYIPDKFRKIEDLIKDVNDRRKSQIRRLKKGKSRVLTPLEEIDKIIETYNFSWISNHVSSNSNDQTLYARRNTAIDWSISKWDLSFHAYFSIAPQGVIEGFKSTSQGLGQLNHEFYFPLHESRQDIVNSIAKKYNSTNPNNTPVDSVCAVSINRLTFEFMEVRPDSNVFGYLLAKGKDHEHNCEVFSLIDTKNDSSKFPTILNTGSVEKIIPKHYYHFWEDKDEHSIRKFMDYIYINDNGYLSYKSNISNKDILEDVNDMETLENIMEQFDINNKARRIRVFKVGEQSSDNNKIIKRVYKWVFKPTQLADFGLLKRTVQKEWEDEVRPVFGPGKPIKKELLLRKKGVRMIPKEFGIGRRLIELDRQAALRKEESENNVKIRALKAIEKNIQAELGGASSDDPIDLTSEEYNKVVKDRQALEKLVKECSKKRKRGARS